MTEEDILRLIEDLDSPDRTVRLQAKEQLTAIGSDAVEPLIEAMRGESIRKGYEAADVLGLIDDERWLGPMAEALTSRNFMLGQMAVSALETHPEYAVKAFIRALPDCHTMVQPTIVGTLERIADSHAVPHLMQLLKSANTAVLRYTIIQALGMLGDPQAVDLIRSFQNDEDHHVRKRALEALKRLDPASNSPVNVVNAK